MQLFPLRVKRGIVELTFSDPAEPAPTTIILRGSHSIYLFPLRRNATLACRQLHSRY